MSTWCAGLGIGGWAMVLLSAAVVVVAVWTITRLFPAAPSPDPRTVLDARLAAGEVDVEAYQALAAELTQSARSR